jgi:hypothetical protein
MGLLKRIGTYFIENSNKLGFLSIFFGSICMSPVILYLGSSVLKCLEYGRGSSEEELIVNFVNFSASCSVPLLLGYLVRNISLLGKSYYGSTIDKKWPRLKKGSRKIRKDIMNRISLEEIANSLPVLEEVSANPSLKEYFLEEFGSILNRDVKTKKIAKKENSPYLLYSAVENFLEKGKIDEGFLLIKDFLNSIKGKRLVNLKGRRTTWFFTEIKNMTIDSYIARLDKYFDVAVRYFFLGSPEKALWVSTVAAEFARAVDHPAKVEASVIDAFFSDTLNSSLSRKKWEKAIELTEELPDWERIGESRSVVKRISGSDFLKNSLVFKESKDLEDLLCEAECSEIFKEKNISSPTPISVSKEKNEKGVYNYIMTCLDGNTLLYFLENKKRKIVNKYLFKIVDSLVAIHSSFPVEKIRYGSLNLNDALEKRLCNPYLSLDEKVFSNLKSGYSFLVDLFKKNKELWRYNKDAHPENWLIDDSGRVSVIDTENSFSCPVVFDLANLFGYGKYFSVNEMKGFVSYYFDRFNDDKTLNIDKGEFEFLFWNALIHRSFFLCSAWSDPSRSSLHAKRVDLIDNALTAFGVIKNDFSDRYENNFYAYSSLYSGFLSLKKKFS